MKIDVGAYQTHWHPHEICDTVASTADTAFIFGRWDLQVRFSARFRETGRVLDVACGNARDIAFMSFYGWEAWGLDPSPLQLRDAKTSAREVGLPVNLVQGVAEWLPFKEGAFESLICKSALDHLVDRDGAMEEFARVLVPSGRAVVSVNNYASFGTRFSRSLYRILRAVWPPARGKRFFWDSPVPAQHMYECTLDNTRELGEPCFDVVNCYGVSLLWGVPGWGKFVSFLPGRISDIVLRALDKLVARPFPRIADVVVFVWQPKAARKRSGEDRGPKRD